MYFFIRTNGSIMISFCFRSYDDLIGRVSATLAFIFSRVVSSFVSVTRLLYFLVSVKRAIEKDQSLLAAIIL